MRANDETRGRVPSQNGEQNIWGEQGQHDLHLDSNSETEAQGVGEIDWAKRFSLSGGDSTGGSGSEEQFSKPVDRGGIRGQLRDLFGLFLEYVHAHRDRLRKRLDENLEFEDKLTQVYEQLDQRLSQLAEKEDSTGRKK